MVKIWITNNAGHHFEKALKFTDIPNDKTALKFLSRGTVNTFHTDRIRSDFEKKLKDFKEKDILLLCGANVLNAVAVKILAQKFKYFQILIFDGRTREYTKREL